MKTNILIIHICILYIRYTYICIINMMYVYYIYTLSRHFSDIFRFGLFSSLLISFRLRGAFGAAWKKDRGKEGKWGKCTRCTTCKIMVWFCLSTKCAYRSTSKGLVRKSKVAPDKARFAYCVLCRLDAVKFEAKFIWSSQSHQLETFSSEAFARNLRLQKAMKSNGIPPAIL